MVNNVIGVVNYVIAADPSLLNFMIADKEVCRSDTYGVRYMLSILFLEPECYEVGRLRRLRFINGAVFARMSFPNRHCY